MIECYINDCTTLEDPLVDRTLMAGLAGRRCDAIMKYKMPADRKRGLMAGIMIREHLGEHGIDVGDVRVTENGRPYVDGIDFNVSHSGDYVIMALSDDSVGCDIEHMRDRPVTVATKYFSDTEKAWMQKQPDERLAFYRIWTARESYIKLTGEGILLEFDRYEVRACEQPVDMTGYSGNIIGATPLSALEVYRDEDKVDYMIDQWLYDNDYVISVCRSAKERK